MARGPREHVQDVVNAKAGHAHQSQRRARWLLRAEQSMAAGQLASAKFEHGLGEISGAW